MFDALASLPAAPLASFPTPIHELSRLRRALGGGPTLLVKRDDAIGFAFGGNKVRKLQLLAAAALRAGAHTLITAGGVQSNHARVTAAAAARLGMRCILVTNGTPPDPPTGNAMLSRLLGADVRYVPSPAERAPAMEEAAGDERRAGRTPFVIPIGGSTPLGAAAYVLAVRELLEQIAPPDVIVHATSSGGTQAGLAAGCALAGVGTRVIGISADEPAPALQAHIRAIIDGLPALVPSLTASDAGRLRDAGIDVDDRFVGGGYGVGTPESREALALTAQSEAVFLDPTYTAKAMAGLFAAVRERRFPDGATIVFWHTGGQVALFA